MKIIRFRGKDIKTGEWVYGSYVADHYLERDDDYDGGYAEKRKPYIQWSRKSGKDIENIKTEVDPETIGMYIGSPDKNGKDIYEKDLLKLDS